MTDRPSENPTVVDGRAERVPSPESIAEHFPRLDIIEVLGFGGMGVVYKARQKGLDRLVALKVLPPDADRGANFEERFAREAQALARLHHPNIVMVHDSGESGGLYYFIMEYVDGVDLRRMMSSGQLPPEQALALIPKICDALQYAHDEGVMHRDIKPENILVDLKGQVKIADFGVAKLISGDKTQYALTAPQQVMGTMHYMAPEQVERPSTVDHRADLYALGVVIYEMLTGELPIGRFPLPSERAPVDHRLDQVVLHALEKEPDRRYQSAVQIKTDVEGIGGHGTVRPLVATPMYANTTGARGADGAAGIPPASPEWQRQLSSIVTPGQKNPGIAYLLWFLGFVGLCGIHRFYSGRIITGIIWLLTGGCFFIGQIVDLFLIPGMVRMSNLEASLIAQEMGRAERRTGVG